MLRRVHHIINLYKSGQLPRRRRHGGGMARVNCPGEIGRNATARFRLNGDGETARERSNFRDHKRPCTSHIGLDKQGYVQPFFGRAIYRPSWRRWRPAGLGVECGLSALNPGR